jgi:polyisoprenoid-binding protein YceI
LNSEDFFNTAAHPDGSFEITKVEDVTDGSATHKITGNLTLKGIAKSVTFPANITINDSGIEAASLDFTIDRAEWDIRYKSNKFFDNLKDDFINDEIGLKIKLTAGA